MNVHETPITVIQDGIAYYCEAYDGDSVQYKGKVELYESWVRLNGPDSTWLPRDRVEKVVEA